MTEQTAWIAATFFLAGTYVGLGLMGFVVMNFVSFRSGDDDE